MVPFHQLSLHFTASPDVIKSRRKSLIKATSRALMFNYYVTENIYRLDSFALCWELRGGRWGWLVSQVRWLWAASPGILPFLPKQAVRKVIQQWDHSVLLDNFLFPMYLNSERIIPLLKWGPPHEDGQRFSWRERKTCSCTRRFSCLDKRGRALWLLCWKALRPGRGISISQTDVPKTQISLSKRSQDALFSFMALNYRNKT